MLTLKANNRIEKKKRVKAVRRVGFLPAVVYGSKFKSENISVSLKEFEKAYKSAGESTLIELEYDAKKVPVIINDVARDAVTLKPIHADFYAVDLAKLMRAKVPLVFTGESQAVKDGAILVKVMQEIEVEALPQDLPHEITVAISSLAAIGDRLTVFALVPPHGVKLRAANEDIIAIIEAQRAEEDIITQVAPEAVAEVKTEQELKRAETEAKKKAEEAAEDKSH